MRGIQLAHHQTDEDVEVLLHGDVLDQRLVAFADGPPIDAVESGIVEVLGQRTPALEEHLVELLLAANRHLGLERNHGSLAAAPWVEAATSPYSRPFPKSPVQAQR